MLIYEGEESGSLLIGFNSIYNKNTKAISCSFLPDRKDIFKVIPFSTTCYVRDYTFAKMLKRWGWPKGDEKMYGSFHIKCFERKTKKGVAHTTYITERIL